MTHARKVPNMLRTLEERLDSAGLDFHDHDLALAGVRAMLRLAGEDPTRDGLLDTPARVLRAWSEMTDRPGNPDTLLATQFEDTAYDEMIVVGPVPFTSLCEHHLLAFTGHAWIGYVPSGGKVVGLSKLPRLLDHYARRPQVQERLTAQVVDAIVEHLEPKGAAVKIVATHACLQLRGARKTGSAMTTQALRGIMFEPAARAEFNAHTLGGNTP